MKKKAEGVPKDTPEKNIIGAVIKSVREVISNFDEENFRLEIDSSGYFEAGMQQQFRIMSGVLLEFSEGMVDDLIKALSESEMERVRGVAPNVALYGSDTLSEKLRRLRFTASVTGTWPREMSCSMLHKIFVEKGVQHVLPAVIEWADNDNEGVRRTLSEALRPRLMMEAHLEEEKRDPTILKGVLWKLMDDESEYVRRSVANCLNDISKDNPKTVIGWAKEAMSSDRIPLFKTALRTLLKDGNGEVLKLLGYENASTFLIEWENTVPAEVEIDNEIPITVFLKNGSDKKSELLVLINMESPGKNRIRSKIYKIADFTLQGREEKIITRKIPFSNRSGEEKLAGIYHLNLIVNGRLIERRSMVYRGKNR